MLLVAMYCRMSLSMPELAPLFGISTTAVGRIVKRHGPLLASRWPSAGLAAMTCSSWTARWCPHGAGRAPLPRTHYHSRKPMS